jgi:ABC-type microcin C transport system permease subunit YejB
VKFRSLGTYVLRRLAQLLPIVVVIVVVNFFLIRLASGDPIVYIIGDR